MTLRGTALLEQGMREREVLKCKIGPGGKGEGCGEIVMVTRSTHGYCAVRPGEWWQPSGENWTGRCACREVRRKTEWDLYRALGWA